MGVKNSYDFVLDCSVTMAWCFEDESSDCTDSILENFHKATALVPTIWSLEVANVLLLAKKNKRITEIQAASFIDALSVLPIVVDQSTTSRAMHSIFVLAGQSDLTIYDAAYLELAIREKIPLLTLDKGLIKAAKKLRIPLKLNETDC
jgi:predicted nucleic acid-binding protein